jgi:uncharacterized protein (TIGR00290 family)
VTAWLSWSSGKDSAFALRELRRGGEVEVSGLLVTVDETRERVAMHDVRQTLVSEQAAALGLPLHVVHLPWPCPNDVYEQRLATAMAAAGVTGVDTVAFGDLYLEDIRGYRERQLAGSGIRPLFPLWGRPTDLLAREMVDSGVRAVLVCVDESRLDPSFAGRWFDRSLLDELPDGVDPCGENGEFHTFVVDAPGFARPLDVRVGATQRRDGFAYADLIPA